MFKSKHSFKSTPSSRKKHKFKVGDRIETFNNCRGTVVRIDRDEIGDYIVARLDAMPHEFAYDPDDLKAI